MSVQSQSSSISSSINSQQRQIQFFDEPSGQEDLLKIDLSKVHDIQSNRNSMDGSATKPSKLKRGKTLLTKKTMKNIPYMKLVTKKEKYQQPQRVYMDVVSSDFGVPIIQPVQLTNQVYIPSNQSMTVHANLSGMVRDKIVLESRIKQIMTWFSGCNTCWATLILFNLFFSINDLLNLKSSHQLAISEQFEAESLNQQSPLITISDYIFIIEYLIWLFSIVIGITGLSQFKLSYFRCYTFGLMFSMILESLARLIEVIFAEKNDIQVFQIFSLWLCTLLFQYIFLYYSRRLSTLIVQWYKYYS